MDGGQLSTIIAGLRGDPDTQLSTLESLTDLLIFSEGLGESLFTMPEIALALVHILDQSPDDQIRSLSLQCINSLLPQQGLLQFIFVRFGLLEKIDRILSATDNTVVAGHCFGILSFYSQEMGSRFPSLVDSRHFFRFLPLLSRIEQRDCVSTLHRIASQQAGAAMLQYLDSILELSRSDDVTIRQHATGILMALFESAPPDSIKLELVIDLCSSATSPDVLRPALGFLLRNCSGRVRFLRETPLDFGNLIFRFLNEGVSDAVLRILQALMPPPNLPQFLWPIEGARWRKSGAFVASTTSLLLHCLSAKVGPDWLVLQTLAACLSLTPIPFDASLCATLLGLTRSSQNIPYLVAIVETAPDKAICYRSGLLQTLAEAKVAKEFREWAKCQTHTMVSRAKRFARQVPRGVLHSQSLHGIVVFLEAERVSAFEFATSKLLDHTVAVLKTSDDCEGLDVLARLANGALDYYRVPKMKLPSDVKSLSKRIVRFNVRAPGGGLGELPVPIVCDFSFIEGWYNLKCNPGIVERLQQSIADNPLLQMMIDVDAAVARSEMRFALYCRAFQTEGYKKCSFRLDGQVFAAFDNIVDAIGRLPGSRFDVELIEEDVRRSKFVIPAFDDSKFGGVFELCRLLSQKTKFAVSERFQEHVFWHLRNPYQTMAMISPAAQLIFSFPFLFTFQRRHFLWRTITLDTQLALKIIHDQFSTVPVRIKSVDTTIHCIVNRQNLFEHGCFLINRLSSGRFRIQFSFEGEAGFGEGPSQEFFSSMAKEYCKRELRMWRDDVRVVSDFVVAPDGYFPAVTADMGLLDILGFLTAKAILMDKILAIPFHPAFFKIVKGEAVAVAEVDPELAASLRAPEGLFGLEFVYLGTEIELKKGGKASLVDEGNVGEYVRLVEDFTCGSFMVAKVACFLRSFQTNIQRETLQLLTAQELASLVAGEELLFTVDDLWAAVKLEHGYGPKSREIKDFFELVVEMVPDDRRLLVKFITGSTRLPAGGLSALRPPLTIAKRVPERGTHPDECLPSVMTCTNYLKLPAYSTRKIMERQIMKAITECQDVFLLS
jgi:E3 ubiquitin-protein ligase TRIP12